MFMKSLKYKHGKQQQRTLWVIYFGIRLTSKVKTKTVNIALREGQ